MTITLAFTIYNKENWVESILKSWIENASNKSNLEIIIVFDDLKDNSKDIAEKYLKDSGLIYKLLFADDKHEIYCNNLALEHSTGDYIIFIQDDNWIFDKGWDQILKKVIIEQKDIGAIALLAGARLISYSLKKRIINYLKKIVKSTIFRKDSNKSFYPSFYYERMESNRKSKGDNFSKHNIPSLSFGIWSIHTITRPFCISRNLLLNYGGLDRTFMPHTGDDIDLSLKLLSDGYHNLYISFDLLNISTIGNNDKHCENKTNVNKAYRINYSRHKKIIKNSKRFSVNQIEKLDFSDPLL